MYCGAVPLDASGLYPDSSFIWHMEFTRSS
jgi:hypothetical protein